MADVLAFTGLEEGSVMTLKANTASAGGNDFTIFNITCEEAGWGGERFVELDLGMGEATRLRDMLDFLIKHEAAHALHKAKQQYNAAIDTQVNSMVDELESQASSTPEQRKALHELINRRSKEVRPDPKSQGEGKNPFANGKIRKWTNK